MPKIDLFPKLSAVSRFICRVVTAPHLLASHGDHFSHWDDDPLASPIEPVTSWPDAPPLASITQLFPDQPEDVA